MLDVLARPQRLSRAEYDHLVELGELEDQRVELIRGTIVEMSPPGPPHAWVVDQLTMFFAAALKGHATVRIQGPLALSDDSEPQPDVAVLEPGDYRHQHPTTALLVIEVAESSLAKDRQVKAPLYAEAGIPEYWIVNTVAECVEVYCHPQAGTYQTVETRTGHDILRPTKLPMLEIAVSDIFRP